MKLSLNEVFLGQPQGFAQYVALADECGYEGVDFSINGLISLASDDPVAAADELFAAHKIAPAAWGLPAEWQGSDEEFENGIADLPGQAETAAAIGCPRCCTWIMAATDKDPDQLRAMIVPRLRQIAGILGEFGVRLGLEWCGPHCFRGQPDQHPFVWRMEHALELAEDIGEPNVGLLVDSFHWFNSGHTSSDLETLSAEQVVHVHINDAPDRPLEEQRDGEREVPGRGIIDLEGFLQALDSIGYGDYLGVEIFNEKLRQMPVEQTACQVRQATAEVMNSALGPDR